MHNDTTQTAPVATSNNLWKSEQSRPHLISGWHHNLLFTRTTFHQQHKVSTHQSTQIRLATKSSAPRHSANL